MKQAEKKALTCKTILDAAIYLFTTYGYEGTTTRMLSSRSKVNISTIFLHFENKEGLYIASINHVAEEMQTYLSPKTKHILSYLEHEPSAEQSWILIEEIVTAIVDTLSDPIQKNSFLLLVREQTNPPNGEYPLSHIIYENVEYPLKCLLQQVYPEVPHTTIALHVRLILSGIIAQSEHPVFLRWMLGIPAEAEIKPRVLNKIKDLSMTYMRTNIDV